MSEARARDDRGPGGPPRPGGGYGAPRPGGFAPRPGGFPPRPGGPGPGGPRPGGFGQRPEGGYAPRPGGFRPGGEVPTSDAAMARARNFGPPAPPKGKKKPNPAYAAKERGPKGPIPTKFTGRVFGLDGEDEGADSADALPDFMKHEDGEGSTGTGGGDASEE